MSQPDKTGLFDPGLDDQAERIAAYLFAEPYEKGDFGRRWDRLALPNDRFYSGYVLLQRVLSTKVPWAHREKLLDESWGRLLPGLVGNTRVERVTAREGIVTVRELWAAAQSGRLLKKPGFGKISQIDVELALQELGIDPTKKP
jgi:hypothetical protein